VPILKREPDVFPAELFRHSERFSAPWWVAHVRSRQEKRLARILVERGIAHYLPKSVREVRRQGRVVRSYLPLFSGYVFFRGTPAVRRAVLQTNLTAQILEVEDQALLDEQLRELWRLQEAGAVLVPHPYIAPGDQVRIREGAFKGYRGTVVREKGSMRLVVSISFLRRSVAAELDREDIEPAG